MIKNLKSKIIICLFLLVTIFNVASSCYASLSTFTSPFTLEDFSSKATLYLPSNYVAIVVGNTDSSYIVSQFFYSSTSIAYGCLSSDNSKVYFYDVNGNKINSGTFHRVYYNNGQWQRDTTSTSLGYVPSRFSEGYVLCDLTNVSIYNTNKTELLYEPIVLGVDVTHEFQSDTSAKVNFTVKNAPDGAILKYSLTGVEISTDLTAPIQLRNPVIYTPRSNKFSC